MEVRRVAYLMGVLYGVIYGIESSHNDARQEEVSRIMMQHCTEQELAEVYMKVKMYARKIERIEKKK